MEQKQNIDDDVPNVPESAEQLSALLIPVESARLLLASKLSLQTLRSLLIGCWIRYQGARERIKDPKKDFFVDLVMYANRDGIRFKNSRENSYRNIQKLREPEIELNKEGFEQWLEDLRRWNEPIPTIVELKSKQITIAKAIEGLRGNNIKEDEHDQETSEQLTRAEMSKLVITVDELVRLLDYGKERFENVAVGFYAMIKAPPNPNSQRKSAVEKGGFLIYMDEIIGVNWLCKPYMYFEKPMTLSLKFRHFRDEKLIALPFREQRSEVGEKVFDQWLEDMREWEEQLPSREFIAQKCRKLNDTFAETVEWQRQQRKQMAHPPPPPPAAYHHHHHHHYYHHNHNLSPYPPSYNNYYSPFPSSPFPQPFPYQAYSPPHPPPHCPYGASSQPLLPPASPYYHPMAHSPNYWQCSSSAYNHHYHQQSPHFPLNTDQQASQPQRWQHGTQRHAERNQKHQPKAKQQKQKGKEKNVGKAGGGGKGRRQTGHGNLLQRQQPPSSTQHHQHQPHFYSPQQPLPPPPPYQQQQQHYHGCAPYYQQRPAPPNPVSSAAAGVVVLPPSPMPTTAAAAIHPYPPSNASDDPPVSTPAGRYYQQWQQECVKWF